MNMEIPALLVGLFCAGALAASMSSGDAMAHAAASIAVRDGVVIYTGRLSSLRRVKDDVREVREGFECGLTIENYDDIKAGDVIESFEVEQERRKL